MLALAKVPRLFVFSAAMPFVPGARGARIHYEVRGSEGPWVVLIMGIGASGALWLDLPERLASEGRPHRVLIVDNLGTGRSDRLRRPYSLSYMASDVVRAMDHAGVDRAYVVGLSMGGMIAQHIALRHAARVEGLVLLATSSGVLHGGLPRPRAIRSLLRMGALRGGERSGGHEVVADLILARAHRHRAGELLARVSPAVRSAPIRRESLVWQLLACSAHSTGHRLGRITAPAVVVTGDDDIVMGRHASHVLASRIPLAALEVVPGCGHGIAFTHPEWVERAVARVRELASRRAGEAPSARAELALGER